jgi:hypothetical protein
MAGRMAVGLSKVSSLPADEILDSEGYPGQSWQPLPPRSTPISTVAPFCYLITRYMTAYYYDYRDDDDNKSGMTPPTALSASAASKGGGGAAARTNTIIEAAMREII